MCPPAQHQRTLRLAVVVSFRDESRYLPRLFRSIARQTQPADQLILIDDGSGDSSLELAQEFARGHTNVRALSRRSLETDNRPPDTDRLVDAPELKAFAWGVEQLDEPWDIVTKMDGDLELPSTLFADVRRAFDIRPGLGIAGSYLSVQNGGSTRREPHPSNHVRGPNKFYRRACYEQISPLPAFLGWDTIDELRARRAGWTTASIDPEAGDAIHLRPTGSHNGRARAFRRWGRCAWGYGAHPLGVLGGAIRRMNERPYILGSLSYLLGWIHAAITRQPRAERETRRFCQGEELQRIRMKLSRAG